jgi:hypothetical protein
MGDETPRKSRKKIFDAIVVHAASPAVVRDIVATGIISTL